MYHPIFATQMDDCLAAVLCLWRVSHLFSVEKGPFGLISRFRAWLGNGFFGELLDCFYCVSAWLAIPLAILAGDGWAQRLLLWPALSAAACLLEQATKRTEFPCVFEEAPEEEK